MHAHSTIGAGAVVCGAVAACWYGVHDDPYSGLLCIYI